VNIIVSTPLNKRRIKIQKINKNTINMLFGVGGSLKEKRSIDLAPASFKLFLGHAL